MAILQVQEIRASGKSQEELVSALVKQVNTLSSQLNYALQNIGAENIVTESGSSLEDLYAMGALNGADGKDGTNGVDGKDGIDGINGTNGIDGKDGVGVPAGGLTGQVLAKKSDADFDTEWITLV